MKKMFYGSLLCFALFEVLNVYFIMPMPGISQEINSLDFAYFLYTWRWIFRAVFLALIVLGFRHAFRSSAWIPVISLLAVLALGYVINFNMAADSMFRQPGVLKMNAVDQNSVGNEKLVIGISLNGEARAYPIQFIGYHHQVRDSIAGKPVMVTYCTVCRTGRVFEPLVEGKPETFRLVGMDHYNAMFEDGSTGSWWRQVTGEAVAGKLKGKRLPEFPSMQTTLAKWIALHPNSLVMQADPAFRASYDSMGTYEKGKPTGRLTRRDTASWQEKSWVIGVETGFASKAFDWNRLQKEKLIHDEVGGKPVLVALAEDNASFVVLERIKKEQVFRIQNDTLISDFGRYSFSGRAIDSGWQDLNRLNGYQEYWHSWQSFHPATKR